MRSLYRLPLAAILTAAIAGCSGGGGTPAPSPVPAPIAPTAPQSATAHGTLAFTIIVPGRTPSTLAHRRLPAYVSTSTSQARLTVQGQNEASPEAPQTYPCTSVCTGSFSAPAGVDRVTLQLLDAGGFVLSSGTSTVVVFSGQTNQLSFTLDGVVATVDLTVTNASVPVVPASSGYVLFNGRDLDGNIVTYNGGFADANDSPLVFDIKSSKASFVLGVTTVSGPGTLIPYTYSGTDHVGTVTLTPSLHPGVTATTKFTAATVSLLPGILRRITPSVPIAVLGVTQAPVGNQAFDPNADLVIGNGAGTPVVLAYDTVKGTYTRAFTQAATGTLSSVPLLTGDGYSSYVAIGSNTFTTLYESSSSTGISGGAANPCSSGAPIGFTPANTYCYAAGFSPRVFITGGADIGNGLARKLQSINGTLYVVTVGNGGPVVSIGGTPVAKSLSVGADVDDPTMNAVIGYSNGSVLDAQSNASFGQFTQPVTGVIRNAAGTYVLENRAFGISSSSGVFETSQLPIGNPIDLIIGPSGTPAIVESDGTIDLIGV